MYVLSCAIVLSFTFLVVIILMCYIYIIYECIRLTSNLARWVFCLFFNSIYT